MNTASSETEPSIQACQKISSLRRSKISAVAPATRPNSSTGSEAAVCISAISSGDVVSTVISQVAAVSCIHVPTDETVDAIQRSRNSATFRGAKPDVTAGAEASAAGAVSGEERGTPASLPGLRYWPVSR